MTTTFWIIIVFIAGYAAIIGEHKTGVNKTAVALITAVLCWVLVSVGYFPQTDRAIGPLNAHLADTSQVMIFLLGAMTIVELINSHNGFQLITRFITTRDKRTLLWQISLVTFFVSAVLDNLTTAIIMVLLLRRYIPEHKDRFLFAGMIIVAANAGGAWSPIGDVTTTMLWIDDRVSSGKLISTLLLPSLVSLIVPLLCFSRTLSREKLVPAAAVKPEHFPTGTKRVFILGVAALVFVPVLRGLTGLPPYIGIILGLGLMWALTDLIHQERHYLRVPHVLARIDISSVLFFLGILMAVASLETTGVLDHISRWLDARLGDKNIVVGMLGLLSAVIDNVPLTAAAMGMYPIDSYPLDAKIWPMVAYCAGTGGSLLIIGSAAGVVVMGMENIRFGAYMKKMTLPVLAGYFTGLLVLLLL